MTTLLLRDTKLFILLLPLALSPSRPQLSVGTFVHDPASGKEYRAYDGSLALIVGVDAYTQSKPAALLFLPHIVSKNC